MGYIVEFKAIEIILGILHLFILLNVNGQEPIPVCSQNRPYRLFDSKCANFFEICTKQDDYECDQLQASCKQCPPSKITVKFLHDILRILNYQLMNIMIQILIFNIVIFVLLIIENRFKLITKFCFGLFTKKKFNTYQIIHSRKREIELSNFIGDFGTKLKFRLPTENKVIELHVYGNDNVVNIKKHICKKWPKAQSDSYKIMKLIYKGKCLDDNQNIISLIGSYRGEILCQMDYSVNASDILVLRVAGIRRDTELVQINKGKKIFDLKQILCKLFNCEGISMFVKPSKDEKYSPLKDLDMAFEAAKLCDKARIVVVKEKPVRIKFQSILNDEDPFVIELSRTESVSAIIARLKQKFKSENFVLMMNNCNMESDRFMFQYNIDEESQIKYCRFYEMEERPFSISNMFKKQGLLIKEKATDYITNREVTVMEYKLSDWKAFINNSSLLKELRKLTEMNASERFVRIFAIYKGEGLVSVSMELMAISLKEHFKAVDGKTRIASNDEVIKWYRQILEGLACLHDHGIVYDELTMSHILLDSKGDIKLASINIATAIHGQKRNEINKDYLAPEILDNKAWNIKADVWSFGVILLEIITGKCFNFSAKNEALNDSNFFKIDYSKYVFPRSINERFKGVIDRCLVEDPNYRISVHELLSIDLLRSF